MAKAKPKPKKPVWPPKPGTILNADEERRLRRELAEKARKAKK